LASESGLSHLICVPSVTKEHIDAFVKDCSADANHADYCDIEPVSHLLK
jgi:hypothetical protein